MKNTNNCHISKQYKILVCKDKKEQKKLEKWNQSPLKITPGGDYLFDTQVRYSWERGE